MKQHQKFSLTALAVFGGLFLSFSLLLAETLEEPTTTAIPSSIDERDCAPANLEDPFPDLIVEKILVEAGINASDVPRINRQLDSATEKHLETLKADAEQINGPMALELALQDASHAQFTIYASVMDEYMSDAIIMMETFTDISKQREELIESCLKESKANAN